MAEQMYDKKDISSKYLELREKVLKYSNEDMNLKLENNKQVYLAVFDIPIKSKLVGFNTQTVVLLFGLATQIYHGSGEVITNLEKHADVMRAMQSLFISCPQVLGAMQLTENINYYESNNVRVYLKTSSGIHFKELGSKDKEDRFLNMLLENVLVEIAKALN